MLLWNVLGSVNLLWQLSADAATLASYPETHQAIIIGRPLWATAGFAIGVILGALGCVLLLLKKSSSYYLFQISLAGIAITMVHTLQVSTSIDFELIEFIVMIILPLVVALFLVYYSKLVHKKGWIN
jgi:Ca2+/Na+ antiporter